MLRKIIHVDMDCFYAAVEERENPALKGQPVIVGGEPQSRGVVATANYEARKFGVRSAMSSARAYTLCPHGVFVRPNFKLYKEESLAIREIFSRFTELIEPLSLDEAYLDVTHSNLFGGFASKQAQEIRRLIWTERNLTASAGVAPNKFLAKVASEWKKPNGLTVIPPEKVEGFVKELPIEAVPGIGKVTAKKIHSMGIQSCGDMQKLSRLEMLKHFGKWGDRLYHFVRGEDDRPVNTDRVRKSLSVENTYSSDLIAIDEIHEAAEELYKELIHRLARYPENNYRSLFVKVKFFDFKQTTLERHEYRSPKLEVYKELLSEAWSRESVPVRLIGLGVRFMTEEEGSDQLPLFSD